MNDWFWLKACALLSLAVVVGLLKQHQFDEEKKREEEKEKG